MPWGNCYAPSLQEKKYSSIKKKNKTEKKKKLSKRQTQIWHVLKTREWKSRKLDSKRSNFDLIISKPTIFENRPQNARLTIIPC